MAVIFDLDGTIVDGRQSVKDVAGKVMSEFGVFADYDERDLCGPPLSSFIAKYFDPSMHALALERFRAIYDAEGIRGVTVYPGITKVIDWLIERGEALAVVSNNDSEVVHRVLDIHNLRSKFMFIAGRCESAHQPKPKADLMLEAATSLGVSTAVVIGDTESDFLAAQSIGFPVLMVSYGYRTQEELRIAGVKQIVSSPLELLIELQRSGQPSLTLDDR